MKIFSLFIFFVFSLNSFADSACSRTATINYQEVLVDAGTGKLGEGLRFYLEKDPKSLELLNEYQKRSKPSLWNASASTIGSLMILGGVFQSSSNQNGLGNKNTLIGGGALLITLSYLISKTIKHSNEKFLNRSIDRYNKRNSPRIYFSPFNDNNGKSGIGFGVNKGF